MSRAESKQGALILEKYFTRKCHNLDFMGEILDKLIILIAKKDSAFREDDKNGIKVLKAM